MRKERNRSYRKVGYTSTIRLVFIAFGIVLLTQSCYKDRFGVDKISGGEWDPTLAAPIVNSRLTMEDIKDLSGGIWGDDPSGLVSLIYRDTLLTDISTDLVIIPDQKSDSIFPYTLPINILPGDSDYTYFVHSHRFAMPPNMDIDSIMFKEGTIEVSFKTNINHDCKIEIVVPRLKKYGITNFKQIVYVPYDGNPTRTVTVSYPLVDYSMGLDDDGFGNKVFTQIIQVKTLMSSLPNLSPNYWFEVSQELKDLDYFAAFGFFGQTQLNLSASTISIGLFKNNYIGNVFLEDPVLTLDVENSYGTDFDFVFDEMYVTREATKMDLTSPMLPSLPLNGVPVSDYGTTKKTAFVFDKTNSNIVDAVNLNPHELYLDAHVKSNPTWSTFTRNFVNDTNVINVFTELEMPFHGKALDFTISDTSKFSLDAIDEIRSLELRINTRNLFPIDGLLQIYFADSNGVAIDSAFVSGGSLVLNSASVGPAPDYRAVTPANQTAVVTLDGSRLANLFKMEKIIVNASISTVNGGNDIMKIYSDYYVDVVISSKADIYVEF